MLYVGIDAHKSTSQITVGEDSVVISDVHRYLAQAARHRFANALWACKEMCPVLPSPAENS